MAFFIFYPQGIYLTVVVSREKSGRCFYSHDTKPRAESLILYSTWTFIDGDVSFLYDIFFNKYTVYHINTKQSNLSLFALWLSLLYIWPNKSQSARGYFSTTDRLNYISLFYYPWDSWQSVSLGSLANLTTGNHLPTIPFFEDNSFYFGLIISFNRK